MASFPDSVFAPANRSNGQTIDASHINNLQDEVVAIEGGIINGTARVNSSVLNVTAGSTFAVRPVEPPPHGAKVYLENSKDLGSSAASTFAFTAQEFAINSSVHSTGTNPERLTPQSTGVYYCVGQMTLAGNPTGGTQLSVFLADSTGTFSRCDYTMSAVGGMQVVGIKRFDVLGGYVRMTFANSGGSTLSLSSGATGTWLSMVKL